MLWSAVQVEPSRAEWGGGGVEWHGGVIKKIRKLERNIDTPWATLVLSACIPFNISSFSFRVNVRVRISSFGRTRIGMITIVVSVFTVWY